MTAGGLDAYVHLATRLVLDSVTYSNPLPEWEDAPSVDYEAHEERVTRRIEAYLGGRTKPVPPTPVAVPRRDGVLKPWLVPSINDQIALQVASYALAQSVERTQIVDSGRVFSHDLYHGDRLAFTTSQFEKWNAFQNTSRLRVQGKQVLQLDLEKAYESIDIGRFLAFFRELSVNAPESALLGALLRGFAAFTRGLPLINDSLFYLGNAYLTVVDSIVARYATDFIRFVDDYRIFDKSRTRLEDLVEPINKDLYAIGFRLNPRKTRLGSEYDFLTTQSLRETTDAVEYTSAIVFENVMDPKVLSGKIAKVINGNGDFGEGMGRYVMQIVRRVRFTAKLFGGNLDDHRASLRAANILPPLLERIRRYAESPEHEWRLIWCLYLCEDFPDASEEIQSVIRSIDLAKLPPVARLWTIRVATRDRHAPIPLEEQHELSYVDAGMARYGVQI
jgi:hypothetical protein